MHLSALFIVHDKFLSQRNSCAPDDMGLFVLGHGMKDITKYHISSIKICKYNKGVE
jgi:hypothetical protein